MVQIIRIFLFGELLGREIVMYTKLLNWPDTKEFKINKYNCLKKPMWASFDELKWPPPTIV